MSLEHELNELGRILSQPEPARAPEPYRDPGVAERKPMRNISPNQFALPGMEGLSHPGARHLPKGISFHHVEEKDPFYGHSNFLYAHKMSPEKFTPQVHHGNALGHIQWAGSTATKTSQGANYPGEIEYVERAYGAERHKGLMTDLYRMGHELNMGQGTVPIHSPTRTPEGEEWSKKVGGPRPKVGDYGWKPPVGVHPYEHRNISQQQFRPKGQQKLPGMGALTGMKPLPE